METLGLVHGVYTGSFCRYFWIFMNLLLNDIHLFLRGGVVCFLRWSLIAREDVYPLDLRDGRARCFGIEIVGRLLLRVVERSHLFSV